MAFEPIRDLYVGVKTFRDRVTPWLSIPEPQSAEQGGTKGGTAAGRRPVAESSLKGSYTDSNKPPDFNRNGIIFELI